MIDGMRIAVVLPANNSEKTLEKTVQELPPTVDATILVDDVSTDATARIARQLGLTVVSHDKDSGYGARQKLGYRAALESGADVVVMVHPDYQYKPTLVTAMAGMITSGVYDVVLASRILDRRVLRGGMPLYKFIANRFLTAFENVLIGAKISEYHTGYGAFSRRVLETLPLLENSDDFVFDNEMLMQAVHAKFRIGEISCPTSYFEEASSGLPYGLSVISTTLKYILQRLGLAHFRILDPAGRRLIALLPRRSEASMMSEEPVERLS